MSRQTKNIIITVICCFIGFTVIDYAIDYINDKEYDYAEQIKGTWKHVEISSNDIQFGYGIIQKVTLDSLNNVINAEYGDNYEIKGNKLSLGLFDSGTVMIYSERDKIYLEIYSLKNYAGKYVKVK